jgi:hypothetical protein
MTKIPQAVQRRQPIFFCKLDKPRRVENEHWVAQNQDATYAFPRCSFKSLADIGHILHAILLEAQIERLSGSPARRHDRTVDWVAWVEKSPHQLELRNRLSQQLQLFLNRDLSKIGRSSDVPTWTHETGD